MQTNSSSQPQRRLKLNITGKFTLAFGIMLGLVVIIAATGLLSLIAIYNHLNAILATAPQNLPPAVIEPLQQMSQISRMSIIILLIAVLLAIVAAFIIAAQLHKRITQNVKKLTVAATELQQGNLGVQVHMDSDDELGQLADTLNLLSAQVTELIDNLEEKAAESHNRLLESIESISEGVALYDANDRLMLFNSTYRHMHHALDRVISIGTQFQRIISYAANQGYFVDAVNKGDEWLNWRLLKHRNPHGPFEQQLSDGRWLQVSEYKTTDGGVFCIHSDITDRKRVEETLQRHNQYLETLYENTMSLLSHLNLSDLLDDTVARVTELLGTSHGFIYLVDSHGQELKCKVGTGIFEGQVEGQSFVQGQGVPGKVWQSGQPLVVNNFQNWVERKLTNVDSVREIAAVPLKSGAQVVGVIGTAYDNTTQQKFEISEVKLLTHVADLTSLALDNARLYTTAQEEKTRSDKLLNVVIPIGVALTAEQNFDRLLEKILLESKIFCNADAGTLYLRTEEDTLKFVLVRNDSLNINMGGTSSNPIDFPPVPLHTEDGQPNHSSVAAHVALTGEAISIPDAYRVDGFNFSGTKNFDQNTGYRSTSFLTIPLKNARDHVLGVLQLINAQDEAGRVIPFDDSLVQLVSSLSSLAAVALEAYVREQNLRQQIQQLRIEIDEVKRQRQVTEITETDFFQDLQDKARNLRRRGPEETQQEDDSDN